MKENSLPKKNGELYFGTSGKGFTKKMICLLAVVLAGVQVRAQLSGTYTIPGSFPTLAAAISSLNAAGVNGAVTIDIAAGYTETVPVGGYVLTATGTGANPILFEKSGTGANPLLTAYSGGTATAASATQDGIWQLVGSDFVTIQSIDLIDLNNTGPATMEFGYGLYKASATDGCQHNSIVNCNITLSNSNNTSGSLPALDGSRGIDVVNAIPSAITTSLMVTAASGANSNNGFFANTIQNCNYGIVINGFEDVFPFAFSDSGNMMSINTIVNFGGAPSAVNPAAGIVAFGQQQISITANNINNNNGQSQDHPATLRGIYIVTPDSAVIAVSGNVITLHGGGTSSQLAGIECAGNTGVDNNINITANVITGCTYATATSGNFYGILNSAASNVLTLSGNFFYNNSTASGSGTYYNIYNSGNINYSVSIDGNTVDTLNFTAPVVSSSVCNIYCAGTSTTNVADFSGNSFKNINFNGASGSTGLYAGIYLAANLDTAYVAGNSFKNLNLNTTGPVYLIYNNGSTPFMNVLGNNVPGFTRTAASGDTYFYNGTNSSGSGSTTVSFNYIKNVLQQGASAFYGISNVANASPFQEFATNMIDSVSSGSGLTSIISMTAGNSTNCFNNTISNITGGGIVYGIQCSSGISSTSIHQNTLFGFQGTGASTVAPLYLSSDSRANIYKNKIYSISNSNIGGSVYGVLVAGSNSATPMQNDTISDNIIGDLSTPVANTAMPLAGIYLEGGDTINVWYNTVNLSATSSGSLFGSSAFYTSTDINLGLKNNILVNNSASSGTGITSAYRRSTPNLLSYLSGSDNNLFYAGPVASGNSILYNGIAYPYLSAYKTLMSGKDLLSVTENPPFISTTGSSSNYLDLDPNIPTQAEGGATPIAFVTDDYAYNQRNSSTPDIGAWENNYTAAGDILEPTLLAKGYTNADCITAQRTLTVSLTDGAAVAGGSLSPVIYYKVNSGTYSSSQGLLTSGTSSNGVWSFTLNYTTVPLDVISYYVLAQDVSTPPNVLSSPPNGFAGSSVLNVTTPPSTQYTFVIASPPSVNIPNVSVCAGDTAQLVAFGNGTLTYVWTGPSGYTATAQMAIVPTLTNSSSGVYTLVATSANFCISTATTNLIVNALPVFTVPSSSVCLGSTATLSASGASNSVYSWFGPNGFMSTGQSVGVNAMNASAGSYSVTAIDLNGCSASATASLTVLALPVISTSASTVTICKGETAALSVSGAASYSWIPASGNNSSITVTPVQTTSYVGFGAGLNGCTNSLTIQVVVNDCTGLTTIASNNPVVNVFPNPSSGQVTAAMSVDGQKEITVTNMLGEIVYRLSTNNQIEIMDLTLLSKGAYFIKVMTPLQQSTIKFIKL